MSDKSLLASDVNKIALYQHLSQCFMGETMDILIFICVEGLERSFSNFVEDVILAIGES